MTKTTTFRVGRDDLRTCGFTDGEVAIADGEVLLGIDRFALTANNITYAVFGEAMSYWNFFPAAEGWGNVPVWGFGDVVESRFEGIEVGERIYGYLPMSSHVALQPGRVDEGSFMDVVEYRRPLPAAYQHYTRCANDKLYEASREDHHAIFYPLFFTSFMVEDVLSDSDYFGATQIVIASASSKTALGIAFLLSIKPGHPRVVALTSTKNSDFCAKTGCYDEIITYDDVASIDPSVPTVFVDVAGNGQLLRDIHEHLDTGLTHSLIVGATHWEQRETQHDLPGPQPQTFFAPTQGAKRRRNWGVEGVNARILDAWRAFLPAVDPWLEVRHGEAGDVERVYREVLEGQQPAHVGHILTLD